MEEVLVKLENEVKTHNSGEDNLVQLYRLLFLQSWADFEVRIASLLLPWLQVQFTLDDSILDIILRVCIFSCYSVSIDHFKMW